MPLLALLLSCAGSLVQAQAPASEPAPQAPHYRLYHPDNPPWGSSVSQDGFIVEIAETALRRAGVEFDTVYAPWKREQAMVQKNANSFMAPLTRLEHREDLYIWIAPVNISFLQLVTRSDLLVGAPIESLQDIPVTARMESPAEFKLKDLGFRAITIVEDEGAAARLIQANRVLIWMQRGLPGHWAYSKAGGKVQDLKVIRFWRTPLQYLVASRDTDPALIEHVRSILEEMRVSGEMDRIKQSYFSFPLNCEILFTCAASLPEDSTGEDEGRAPGR